VGDQAGIGTACGNIGDCYFRMEQYAKATELHEEQKKTAEEVGNRAGVVSCGVAPLRTRTCFVLVRIS
jgi:hypothetical protein